jgi:hypothetical protein
MVSLISKILTPLYFIVSLLVIVYSYLLYKITYEKNKIIVTPGNGYYELLEFVNGDINKVDKILYIYNYYFIEITTVLALSSLIMLLYIFSNLFRKINFIPRLLIFVLVVGLSLYGIYLFFLIRELKSITEKILTDDGLNRYLAEKELVEYRKNKKTLDTLSKGSIAYLVFSGLMILTTFGKLFFG